MDTPERSFHHFKRETAFTYRKLPFLFLKPLKNGGYSTNKELIPRGIAPYEKACKHYSVELFPLEVFPILLNLMSVI